MYPNPVVNDKLTIQAEKVAILRIYNSSGLLVKEQQLRSGIQEIDLSVLPKGIYNVSIDNKSSFILKQ